jgi:ureidoglycolate lyase
MATLSLPVQTLTPSAFAPYGTVLGSPPANAELAFSNAATDFWHAHFFNAGKDGNPEVLWVNYRNNDGIINALEVHWLTEQAIVPLGAECIIHVVALSDETGAQPDLSTLRAFAVPAGYGVCMRPGCWHTTQVRAQEVSCIMLTRSSTTADLIPLLKFNAAATESSLVPLPTTYKLETPEVQPSQHQVGALSGG